MAHLHDLATTIGNLWLLAIISALAAGLAALALSCGTAKVRRKSAPQNYPADGEALLDKYVLAFNQLDQVAQNNPQNVSNLVEQLKSQPGPHLCLKAFEVYVSKSSKQERTRK
ncbi:MAG: hypothetical protein JSS86_15840 [Cyanobacteria bacterium SZAS LIN-2]|nr:hypothetical protein [Cyanobacteria bacterium SZAS LIN-3]MBS1997795.1 hypothetical protein [Cyanobacteria bacterium SZAS LIN-2]MBS2010433.1 hypothetical protein [Cyanobacteria bacterium SZAS TMP-1]